MFMPCIRKPMLMDQNESVTQLIDNLKMNKGKEVSLEPNRKMDIKVIE